MCCLFYQPSRLVMSYSSSLNPRNTEQTFGKLKRGSNEDTCPSLQLQAYMEAWIFAAMPRKFFWYHQHTRKHELMRMNITNCNIQYPISNIQYLIYNVLVWVIDIKSMKYGIFLIAGFIGTIKCENAIMFDFFIARFISTIIRGQALCKCNWYCSQQ